MAKQCNLAVKSNLRSPRKNRIVVLEDLDFIWDRHELKTVTNLWEQGKSIKTISKKSNRDPDEILLALIHLAREDKIKQRKGGLFG